MSSNAKPLWMQLPEGALKLQLLAEIADLVQLTSRELGELWMPPARASGKDRGQGRRAQAHNNGFEAAASSFGSAGSFGDPDGRGTYGARISASRSRLGGRARPASRADHAARILLGQSQLWETLSGEDHALLCELPEPHGALFVWLETQLHEHGPLTWSALRGEIQGQTFEDLALRLMSGPQAADESAEETVQELRNLLARMLIDRIKEQETQAIAQSASDPRALERYRALQARRRVLEQQCAGTIPP